MNACVKLFVFMFLAGVKECKSSSIVEPEMKGNPSKILYLEESNSLYLRMGENKSLKK